MLFQVEARITDHIRPTQDGHGYAVFLKQEPQASQDFSFLEYLLTQTVDAEEHRYKREFSTAAIFPFLSAGEQRFSTSVKEVWDLNGEEIFATPYRRQLLIRMREEPGSDFLTRNFGTGEILIYSQVQLGGRRYDSFHLLDADKNPLSGKIENVPFRKFPDELKAAFNETMDRLKTLHGRETVTAAEIIVAREKELAEDPHFTYMNPLRNDVDWQQRIRDGVQASGFRSGFLW